MYPFSDYVFVSLSLCFVDDEKIVAHKKALEKETCLKLYNLFLIFFTI